MHQNPPKRIDDLMSEISQYDPSHRIQFNNCTQIINHENEIDHGDSIQVLKPSNSLENVINTTSTSSQPSAVYYPPGIIDSPHHTEVIIRSSDGIKNRSEKKCRNEGAGLENNQGAAVVPICLPLCCAAPCTIL